MKEHKARKRFGQNFLQDTRIIADIVNAVRPQADDVVIEIGPGLAAITEPLAKKLNCLHVIEIDRDIVRRLKTLPFQTACEDLQMHDSNMACIREKGRLKCLHRRFQTASVWCQTTWVWCSSPLRSRITPKR